MGSRILLCLLLSLLTISTARADTTVKRLAPGVTLTQEIDKITPLVINVLTVDLTAPGVRLGVGIGDDKITGADGAGGREEVSHLVQRTGALAAVNADFFPFTGDPLGLGIKDGELFSEPWWGDGKAGPRVALGVLPFSKMVVFANLGFLGDLQAQDGQRIALGGLNRAVGKGEVVAFSSLYGPHSGNKAGGTEVVLRGVNLPVRANKLMIGHIESVNGNVAAPQDIPPDGLVLSGGIGAGATWLAQHCHAGERVGFVLAVAPPDSTVAAVKVASLPRTPSDLPSRDGAQINRPAWVWAQMREAVGGGPRLLVHGQIAVDAADEGFDAGFVEHTYPRTAVGTTADGHHLIIVTVDGRQAISKGVSLTDLALILKRYGATEAINFDGGGSTTMAVGGLVVSSPGGTGAERRVADMLLVYSDKYSPPTPNNGEVGSVQNLRLAAPSVAVTVGSATPLTLMDGGKVLGGTLPDILWQGPATNGVGFVNQKGYFIAGAPGTGIVTALYRGRYVQGQIIVQPRPQPALIETLRAELSPDPGGALDRSLLTARITDQNGKPHAGALLHLRVTGGAADSADIQTNADGDAAIGIAWSSEGGSVIVTSGSLAPITLKQP